ncbi:conserved protein, unknown function [Hepatocystis sp. ex Piliocolobus tephrosceles]|nr:conserved protein, unknown function [Hepatocystis sp. ex Piliocolobus tephrosceles]
MNNTSIMSSQEVGSQKSVIFKNRAKHLMQQSVRNSSECQISQKSGTSITEKIKSLFSAKAYKPTSLQKTTLKKNNEVTDQNKSLKPVNNIPFSVDPHVEWQPIYRETCQIRLPIEETNTEEPVQGDYLTSWMSSQNKLTQEMKTSVTKNNDNVLNGTNNDSECNLAPDNCLLNNLLPQKKDITDEDKENQEDLKCYYNYYLVDDYLESLVLSQNKLLDATGLDENGVLYDNVSLNVKPILTLKTRLENGIPYYPDDLKN